MPYALCAMLFLLFPACGEKINPGTTSSTPPVHRGVALETANVTEHPFLYEAVGTVQAGATIHLAGKLMGTIERVDVREGDRVTAGQILVVIDQRQVEAGLRQAQAAVAEAKKGLTAAESSREAAVASERLTVSTYERYQNLKREDTVSAQEFDEVQARYLQAKAGVNQAQAMVETATARVQRAEAAFASALVTRKDAVVTAPYEGTITAKHVEVGDLASPGAPLLTMDTIEGFRVDMILPESHIADVKTGESVSVSIPAVGAAALQGMLRTIVPSADLRTRSFLIKVSLPQDLPLKSGMFARVEVPLGRTPKILIPAEAAIHQGQLTGLFVVDTQWIAHFHLVRLGNTYGDKVEILSGLRSGDRYVARQVPQLKDGDRVEVRQ
jgi:multidrug efflux pump subunit AcrA (membrane-fusion protein)